MFYYLYEVKNLINNKVYVGVHKTKSMDDGYMGSGKVIIHAIKKYGIENFIKVILETFENSVEMFAREKEVVTDEFLARDDTYNLRRGGFGGFDFINSTGLNDRTGMVHSTNSRLQMSINGKAAVTEERREATRNRMLGDNSPMKNKAISNKVSAALTGINKTEDHTRHISEAISLLHRTGAYLNSPITKTGSDHPCFGRRWITDDIQDRKVPGDYILPVGWRYGKRFQKRK
jgi:hypothetical protein